MRRNARRTDIDPKEYEGIIGRLREAREKAGLTQEELADAIGADRVVINKIELNRRRLDAQELKLLCERLAISADAILGLPGQHKR